MNETCEMRTSNSSLLILLLLIGDKYLNYEIDIHQLSFYFISDYNGEGALSEREGP